MVPVRHFKICPAPMVDPDRVFAGAPAVASRTSGFAMLRHHSHLSVSRLYAARVPPHVAGVARNRLRISVPVVAAIPVVNAAVMIHVTISLTLILKDRIRSGCKIRAACVIHPDSPFIGAPAVTFRTSRVAVLLQKAHSASRIK